MKIVYLIAGMYRPAGMERVLAEKAGHLVRRGHDVLIVTTEQKGRPLAFELDRGIRTVDLGIGYEDNNGGSFVSKLMRHPFRLLRHRRRLSALLKSERADVTVSMFCNDASFVPSIKDGSRKILEIHFSRFKRLQYGRKGLWAIADRLRSRLDAITVSRFDKFVALTEEDRKYWGKMPNICVIPNPRTFPPFNPGNSGALRETDGAPLTVLAVGRYDEQKGFDRLIRIWKRLKDSSQAQGWTLRIAGDGPLREALERQAEELGVREGIVFGKAEGDIRTLYATADILALTSRYEGLPMVLLEAQACALPVVAMACKCGPRDVLRDGVDGVLTPDGDEEAFAAALGALMADAPRRRRMGAAALENSDRYAPEAIMDRWEAIFKGEAQA